MVRLLVVVEQREFGIDEDRVAPGPQGLHIGDYFGLGHPCQLDEIGDVKVSALMPTLRRGATVLGQCVDCQLQCIVANGVDVDVEGIVFESGDDLVGLLGFEHQPTIFVIVTAVRVFGRADEVFTYAVEHDLHDRGLQTISAPVAVDALNRS